MSRRNKHHGNHAVERNGVGHEPGAAARRMRQIRRWYLTHENGLVRAPLPHAVGSLGAKPTMGGA